jgi:A/G-specific adenine glycosylase
MSRRAEARWQLSCANVGPQAEHVEAVQQRVLDWYAQHARDLPWRQTRDPYAVLVSEIMLQQTQVERVIPKWHAWLRQFPTLADLARASRADAIRAWQGLGYNLRAVRLHEIAGQVAAEFGGELPRSLEGLLSLKGVGRYTAGAVACFAFGQPVAMVDTNVRRVLSRVFGGQGESAQALADAVVPRQAAYAWNQALMDLGATLCRAEAPLCLVCPLMEVCASAGQVRRRVGRRVGRRSTPPPFAGSTRYFRGRVLDGLRTLPVGAAMSVAELAAGMQPACAPERLEGLLERMTADGLVVRDERGWLRLPD